LVTEVIVGLPGSVAGVTGSDAAEGTLVPMELVAVTVKVYVSPLVRPVTGIGLVEPVPVSPPLVPVVSVAVTV
jgi:hypothetical protein